MSFRTKTRPTGRASSQAIGAAAERVAAAALHRWGFKCIEKIETGWRMCGKGSPKAKVSGDFRAVGEAGRSVLVEVKRRATRRRDGECTLSWTVLEDHQIDRLDEHQKAGGQSVVVWECSKGVALVPWRGEVPWGLNVPMTWTNAAERAKVILTSDYAQQGIPIKGAVRELYA